MSSSSTNPITSRQKWLRRLPTLMIAAGVLLVLVWLGTKTWRIYGAAQRLTALQERAPAVLADPTTEAVDQLVRDIHADLTVLTTETAVFLPLTAYLEWLPRVGPLMPIAPDLHTAATAGADMLLHLGTGLAPAVDPLTTGDGPLTERLPAVLATIEAAEADIQQAQTLLPAVLAGYESLQNQPGAIDALPWAVRSRLPQLEPLIPTAVSGLDLLPYLPKLAGYDQPRRYLIVAQNEDELRATGGFISGYGIVTLDQGQIAELSFGDPYQIDDFTKPYDLPPEPIETFMGGQLLVFRDANYWPHFPTSAQRLIDLYAYGTDQSVDGLIALNQQFLQSILAATGPIDIPELEMRVSRNNIIDQMRAAWAEGDEEGDWRTTRKSFMGPMAAALRQKVEQDFGSIDAELLLKNMLASLARRDLQIYMIDPAVNQHLIQAGWQTTLPTEANPADGDWLMPVNTNMGYNKVNAQIEMSLAYTADLTTALPQSEAVLSYTHPGSISGKMECNPEIPAYRRGLQYTEGLVDRCFWNYVRVYVPEGAQLQSASTHPVPAEKVFTGRPWAGEATAQPAEDTAATVLDNFFLLPFGKTIRNRYTYTLPATVITAENGRTTYTLTVYRPPGAPDMPTTVHVQLPAEATQITADPPAAGREGQTLTFTFDLIADTTLAITYTGAE